MSDETERDDHGVSDETERDDHGGDQAPTRRLDRSEQWRDAPLTPGVVFGLLADKRQRFVLYLLADRGGTTTLDELARHLAALENDAPPELITNEIEHRVYTSLYHADVPKLADHGLVTYDRDAGAVTLTDTGEGLEPYLEFARERELLDVEGFLDRGQRDYG